MREAIGNAFVFNIVIVVIVIVMLLLVGSLGYTKSFKVKNRIINIIEKHDGFDENARDEVREDLAKIGYRVNFETNVCPARSGSKIVYGNNDKGDYHYCVYEYTTSRGSYFHVITFMRFDIPVIGGLLEFPLHGETRIIYYELES